MPSTPTPTAHDEITTAVINRYELAEDTDDGPQLVHFYGPTGLVLTNTFADSTACMDLIDFRGFIAVYVGI